VKEWFKSVLNHRSYPKNKTGYPFLDHFVYIYVREMDRKQRKVLLKCGLEEQWKRCVGRMKSLSRKSRGNEMH